MVRSLVLVIATLIVLLQGQQIEFENVESSTPVHHITHLSDLPSHHITPPEHPEPTSEDNQPPTETPDLPLVNLTNHPFNLTHNSTNHTKKHNRWKFDPPKPSTSSHILDVPKKPVQMPWEDWEKLMPAPLKSDLKPWAESGFDSTDYMRNCTLPATGAVAYLYEGYVYYDNTAHTSNAKYRKFWKLLGVVANYMHEKYPKLPVVRFGFSISSVASMEYNETCTFPKGKAPSAPSIPYFVLAKKPNHPLVRMPTPYFTPLWANEAEKLYRHRLPWEGKNLTGCWIGATNTMPGGRSRLELLAESARLTEKNEDVFRKFFRIHPTTSPVKRFKAWRNLGYFDNRTFELIGRAKTIHKQHTSYFGKCKYNFHLPGHTRGGYSRALQTLLPQGTVVMKYESPWDEYYYDWLIEGKHYVTYTNETLEEKILYYMDHDDQGKIIADASAEFYSEHLTWDSIIRYWEWLILSILKLDHTARKTRIPVTACNCHIDEKRFEGRCTFCSPLFQVVRRQKRRDKQRRIQAKREAEAAKLALAEMGEEDDAD